jgi:hypothetical protein
MHHPSIWRRLGEFVHQDFFDFYPDFWSGIDLFLSELSASDKTQLATHLRSLLDRSLSDAQLTRAWSESGSEILIEGPGAREVLKDLLRRVEA